MSLFSKLFTAPKLPPIDLSSVSVDMHSHFIPGIDDGSKTVADSLEMIKALHALGYKKFITTPHIMGDSYRNTPEIIRGGLEKVKEAIQAEKIPVELEAAAEYYVDFDFEAKIAKKELLSFGKNFVLIEISFLNPPDNFDAIIYQMFTQGYRPVLAHVERYPNWFNLERYQQMRDRGILLQINIGSLVGYYSPISKKIAEILIEHTMVDFLGTDCHTMEHTEVLKKCLTAKYLHKVIASGMLKNGQL